jgi:hypothetical protein
MMAYLVPVVEWVAHSQLATYLRNIAWVWPLCETIHFIGLAMVVGVAAFFDLRLLGFFNRVPISACKEFMPWAMVGFALNVTSGIIFLIIFPAQYAYSQTWWFKVFFLRSPARTRSCSRPGWGSGWWRFSPARRHLPRSGPLALYRWFLGSSCCISDACCRTWERRTKGFGLQARGSWTDYQREAASLKSDAPAARGPKPGALRVGSAP